MKGIKYLISVILLVFSLPIPQNEMLYNKALTPADQNEYWRK